MPVQGACPNCGGQMVSVERSGVRIDACRECRGVWLDRGELEQILERERRVVAGAREDDEEFFREMAGHGGHGRHQQYGFDKHTAERMYKDFRSHQSHKKKHRKGFFEQLLD